MLVFLRGITRKATNQHILNSVGAFARNWYDMIDCFLSALTESFAAVMAFPRAFQKALDLLGSRLANHTTKARSPSSGCIDENQLAVCGFTVFSLIDRASRNVLSSPLALLS